MSVTFKFEPAIMAVVAYDENGKALEGSVSARSIEHEPHKHRSRIIDAYTEYRRSQDTARLYPDECPGGLSPYLCQCCKQGARRVQDERTRTAKAIDELIEHGTWRNNSRNDAAVPSQQPGQQLEP